MQKKIVTSAVLTAVLAGPVLAGSTEAPTLEPLVSQAAPIATGPNWTGFYTGGQLGFADVDSNVPGVSGDGVIGGLVLGYDYDLGNYVIGGGLDYDWTDITLTPGVALDNVFRAKLRGGVKVGDGLVYGTGGYANADTSGLGSEDGYFVGLGYEHLIQDNISVGGEVLYHEFDNFNGTTTDVDATTVQVRATFRF